MEILRKLRKERGLTQRELADKAGITQYTVSEIELGHRIDPHPTTLRKLAKALGISVGEFFAEEPTDPKALAPQPEENGQRRAYPYPWMGEAFGDLLSAWLTAVEQGYAPEHCRVIAAAAYDALDAVVPPLAIAREALPLVERRERQQLGRELLQLAHEAYAVFEEGSAEAEADVLVDFEARREEMLHRTREIAS
jgi:transcriptional regulator with XRE-family HTH domain